MRKRMVKYGTKSKVGTWDRRRREGMWRDKN